ncbi:MAG: hypothetical protein OMM_08586 [Candidatus Magnetoglobus multicellularis str. Araruama]|uniref:Uncharacterized protein n=1 Tax=Candidatus Magnetoglobus multicellularis str. Araruama TaxID=890399 RepID=A0A1V1P7I0_9BACT|nr:MAG: hypothetical protein OMM_08586 [Candidatus Magnetoglobus multicellularis str. Araruama]
MLISYVGLWLLLLFQYNMTNIRLSSNPFTAILRAWCISFILHLLGISIFIGLEGKDLYQSGETIQYIVLYYLIIITCIVIDFIVICIFLSRLKRVRQMPGTL